MRPVVPHRKFATALFTVFTLLCVVSICVTFAPSTFGSLPGEKARLTSHLSAHTVSSIEPLCLWNESVVDKQPTGTSSWSSCLHLFGSLQQNQEEPVAGDVTWLERQHGFPAVLENCSCSGTKEPSNSQGSPLLPAAFGWSNYPMIFFKIYFEFCECKCVGV